MRILFRVGLALAVLASTWVSTSHASDRGQTPVQIPALGIPYVSEMSDGSTFIGTVSLDKFRFDGRSLVANGHLRFRDRALPMEFPVKVRRADCSILELEVGPPPYRGLQDPLVILEHPAKSELRKADFCRIAVAFEAGDTDELASQLNEEDLLDAGFLGGNSCSFVKFLECSAVLTGCALVCSVYDPNNPDNCTQCFIFFGAPSCEACL